ncbi:MAG: hypothetical protein KAT74_02080, partial [Candidatus Cloacimonetes bacterium]|nr:hypothetical protein [Candidatus Cloacimonadota bacterium]
NLNAGSDARAKGAPILKTSPTNPGELYLVYAEDPDFLTGGPDECDIFFIKSVDGGGSWSSPPLRVNDDQTVCDQFLPWMDVKSNGIIDIAWYDRRNDLTDIDWDIYVTSSIDAGNSFLPNTMINTTPSYPTPQTPSGAWMGEYLGLVVDSDYGYVGYTSSIPDINGDIYFDKFLNPDLTQTKWEQLPDLSTLGMDINASIDPTGPSVILADDFLCTETGFITDIHIWCSWLNDEIPYEDPTQVNLTLSIHSDIPAGATHSMPGDLLWQKTFGPGEFYPELVNIGLEGWYDPIQGLYLPDGDTECWLYNFYIDPDSAFFQTGTPDIPVVYWLDMQAQPLVDGFFLGWKISLDHWNDDAVYGDGFEPYQGPWWELRYPIDHPYYPESIDLAFKITTEPYGDSLDFGDAPDPNYPTFSASNGANHFIVQGINLGAFIDGEPDGQPNIDATGDDLVGVPDDEDGVVFNGSFVRGSSTQITVTASTPGFLNAWLDFNGDGSWAGEQIFTDVPLTAGTNTLIINVPGGAASGFTYARFRFSSQTGLSYTGSAIDGEVEDYKIFIHEPIEGTKMENPPQYP